MSRVLMVDEVDPLVMATALMLGVQHAKRTARVPRILTQEERIGQARQRERAEWNAAVEQRKADKLAAKGKA